jgi:hypothetical protein
MLWNRLSGVYSHLHDVVIRVDDKAGNVIQTHEHTGKFERVVI